MKTLIRLILSVLPISLYGQTFYLIDSYQLNGYQPYKIHRYALPHEEFGHSFLFNYGDSTILWQPTDALFYKRKGNLEELDASISQQKLRLINNDKIHRYSLKQGKIKHLRSLKIPRKYRKRYMVFNQSMKHGDNYYFVANYNNSDQTDGHDHMYIMRSNDNRIIKATDLNLGKEILLGPWSFQNTAVNTQYFIVSSILRNELYLLDRIDLSIIDTFCFDSFGAKRNIATFDSAFPDQSVSYYLYKPKDAIDQALRMNVMEMPFTKKICLLNDSVLLITQNIEDQQNQRVFTLNLYTKKIVESRECNYRGEGVWSHLAYSDKVYSNTLEQVATISEVEVSDSSTVFIYSIYGFTMEKALHTHENPTFIDIKGDTINLNKYQVIILADESFCSSCYDKLGIGKGVLVVKSSKATTRAAKYSEYKRYKDLWKIKGDLVLMSGVQFNKLATGQKMNVPLPIP